MFQQSALAGEESTAGNGRQPRLIEGVLTGLPLFRQVPRFHIATIASPTRIRSVRRGTVLFRRGDKLPGVVAFAYGSAKLALRRHDGEERVVRFLGAGEAFGEACALQDRPCPVDVATLSDSMFVTMPPGPLLRLVEQDPAFARNLLRSLADKFLGLLAELETSLQQSALQRLAAYLGTLAEPNGTPGTCVAHLPASKTAVAARLGITKETMSRLLRELANRRLIAVTRRDIEVLDRDALAQVTR